LGGPRSSDRHPDSVKRASQEGGFFSGLFAALSVGRSLCSLDRQAHGPGEQDNLESGMVVVFGISSLMVLILLGLLVIQELPAVGR